MLLRRSLSALFFSSALFRFDTQTHTYMQARYLWPLLLSLSWQRCQTVHTLFVVHLSCSWSNLWYYIKCRSFYCYFQQLNARTLSLCVALSFFGPLSLSPTLLLIYHYLSYLMRTLPFSFLFACLPSIDTYRYAQEQQQLLHSSTYTMYKTKSTHLP